MQTTTFPPPGDPFGVTSLTAQRSIPTDGTSSPRPPTDVRVRTANSRVCKIKNVNDVKNSFIAYLKKDESKKAIKEIKNIIFKVLLHILPQKFKAKVRFGFEDPSTTGNILGILSIFYGVYGNKLELEPDFDNQVFEGEYKLKGRIRVVTLLRALWKLYRNKWIRDFISFSKKSVQDI